MSYNYASMSSKLLWALFTLMVSMSTFLIFFDQIIIISWTIFSMDSSFIRLPLILDPWGSIFSSIVLFISANVLKFSSTYMSGDPYIQRFCNLVLLFVASMNFLVFIPHLITLLLGWDGLGLVSFILVIYYQNPKSLAAGMITALMNRVGDVMILLSIGFLLNMSNWSITTLWANSFSPMVSILILAAAMTKSAQIPFSSWLPAAMAAPTPVSALVHSSTLVTAGVFLLIRFYPSLKLISWFNPTLLVIATTTMFMAGTAAVAECDMKKIIALSTLSQLGVMMGSLGLGLPQLAFFHLMTHALFKALLFLTAGSMIHFHHHSQDLRFMGNLSKSSPLTTSCLLISNMALCGSPFLAGFYSKDMILESTLHYPTNSLIIMLFFLATALTASYSMRLAITIIWNASNSNPFQYIDDNHKYMTSPMIILTAGAVSAGSILSWLMFSDLPDPFLPPHLKFLAIAVTALGLVLAYQASLNSAPIFLLSPLIHYFLTSMWFLTPSTSQGLINQPLTLSKTLLALVDQGWLESMGAQGLMKSLSSNSLSLISLNKNHITTHLTLLTIILIPFSML
uniref:NADH-ubiquinone oxidoreductase chain 5 n=1 Tax=Iphione sp. YZ-2018 TaxID=2153332 RepID=A0A343W6H5_9ANNE|nr:NADH dehydrogenase subunit 5 [Iphione sp. YZ-2018]